VLQGDAEASGMHSAILEEGSGAEVEASTDECQDRLSELQRLLKVVTLDEKLEARESPLRLETHHDFLLKEMAWMAADFEVERELRC
tara:strand:+ start:80 stop:340 length:261 start_codon:yes stop_codon:yes gene_type:complete